MPVVAPESPLHDDLKTALATRLWGAAAVALASLGYILLYWNRFVGVSSGGWEFYVPEQILRGRLPYRDFFLIIPPLSALKTALLMQLLGHGLLALRAEAVLERTFLAVLVYWWLSRMFRPAACFVGVFFAMALFASDPADAILSYHHDAAFLAICAGYCASLFLGRRSGRATLPALFAGVFAGMTLLTAQTTGTAITLALAFVVCALELRARRFRGGAVFLAAYAAGWLIPVGIAALWLYRQHALHAFLQCVFLSGSAKGPLLRVFVRPFWARKKWVAVVTVTLLAAGWLAYRRPRAASAGSPSFLPGWAAAAALTLAAAWLAGLAALPVQGILSVVETPVLAAALAGSMLLASYHALRFFRARSPEDAQLILLASVGVATAYSLALSWAYYGPMAMPGLALVAVAVLHHFWRRTPARLLLAGLCFSMVFLEAAAKYEMPFAWMHWSEISSPGPPHRSSLPQLAGLAISQPTGDMVDRITALILAHAPAGGTLFVYPYFPMFYVLTGLRPPTYGFVHFLDVAPDAVCEQDARTLLARPPSVIVRLREREAVVRFDEAYYRGSAPSGGRKIEAAMDELSPHYKLLETIRIPGSGEDLQILARE